MALADDLVAYYPLDEASGSALDAHTNGYDLTETGTVGSAAGKIGNARDFENSLVVALRTAGNSDFNPTSFTFTQWVRFESLSTNQNLLSKGSTSDILTRYNSSASRIELIVNASLPSQTVVRANNFGAPSTATWYFVVSRYDAAAQQLAISINAGTPDTGSVASITHRGTTFTLGASSASTVELDGLMDEVGYWSRYLSDSEITDLFNSNNGRDYAYIIGGGGGGGGEGSASLASVAILTATGYRTSNGSSSLAAVALPVAVGYRISSGSSTVAGVAILVGVGYRESAGTGSLIAVGTLSATGYRTSAGASALDCVDGSTATGYIDTSGGSSLTAIATPVGVGYRESAGVAVPVAIGVLTATGYVATSGSAQLAAIASLVGIGYRESAGTSAVVSIASLAAVGYIETSGGAIVQAIATLAATGYRASEGVGVCEAVGVLEAEGSDASHPRATTFYVAYGAPIIPTAVIIATADPFAVSDALEVVRASGAPTTPNIVLGTESKPIQVNQ